MYTELVEVSRAEEMYTQTLELTQRIQEYILQLEEKTNHIFQFNDEMDISGLLKMMEVKIEDSDDFFFERLCSYIKNAVNVLGAVSYTHLDVYKRQEESTVTETPTPTPSSDGGNSGGSENHSGGYGGGKSPKTGDDTPILSLIHI